MEEKKELLKNKTVRITLAVSIVILFLLIGICLGVEIGRYHNGPGNFSAAGCGCHGGNFKDKELRNAESGCKGLRGQEQEQKESGCPFRSAPTQNNTPNITPSAGEYPSGINTQVPTPSIQ